MKPMTRSYALAAVGYVCAILEKEQKPFNVGQLYFIPSHGEHYDSAGNLVPTPTIEIYHEPPDDPETYQYRVRYVEENEEKCGQCPKHETYGKRGTCEEATECREGMCVKYGTCTRFGTCVKLKTGTCGRFADSIKIVL